VTEIASPPPVAEGLSKETGKLRSEGMPSIFVYFRVVNGLVDFKDSTDKSARSVSILHKPPTSMPILAAPRRPAPPRRKKTLKLSDKPSAEEKAAVAEVETPLPGSASILPVNSEGVKAEVLPGVHLKSIPAIKPSPPAQGESSELAKDSGLVIKGSTSQTLAKLVDRDHVQEYTGTPSPLEKNQKEQLGGGDFTDMMSLSLVVEDAFKGTGQQGML
jgi:hypothetical protein